MMTRKDYVKTASILKNHFENNPQLTQEVFEDLVDEVLKLRLVSATRIASSHSVSGAYIKPINNNYYGTINVASGSSNGILNTITANSNTIAWDPNTHTNLPSSMLMAIKDLQDQIDKLKNK